MVEIKFKNIGTNFDKRQTIVLKKFINFLQKEVPLTESISIFFLDKREGKMTTGIRKPNHKLYVLVGDRLLVDVLRTLSHEWVHEFQHQKMGLSDKKKVKQIGGKWENMANAVSGMLTKKFQKENPKLDDVLY